MGQWIQFLPVDYRHQVTNNGADRFRIFLRLDAPVNDVVLDSATQTGDSFRFPDSTFADLQESPVLGNDLKTVIDKLVGERVQDHVHAPAICQVQDLGSEIQGTRIQDVSNAH